MSSKYTFYAWEKSLKSASEKLVLLKLADMADHNGMVSFELSELVQDCLVDEFKLANILTSIVSQGLLEKTQLERRGKREIHCFKLLLTDTVELQVYTPDDIAKSAPPLITPATQSGAPSWTSRSFGLYKIPATVRDAIWQKFARENNTNTTNLFRLENQFESWLDHAKQSGELSDYLGTPSRQSKQTRSAPQKAQSGSGYLSTHDLNEHQIPEWAQQTLVHAGLPTDLSLFWERFVVYYKSRANEYISKTQLLNKLRYWIVNEKQSLQNRKQAEERRQATYQANHAPQKKLSPSEEFREYLRSQGKKPNF